MWSWIASTNQSEATVLAGLATGALALLGVLLGFFSVRAQIRANKEEAQKQREHDIKRHAFMDFADAYSQRLVESLPTTPMNLQRSLEIHERVEAALAKLHLVASMSTIRFANAYVASVNQLATACSKKRAEIRGLNEAQQHLEEQVNRIRDLARGVEAQIRRGARDGQEEAALRREFHSYWGLMIELHCNLTGIKLESLKLERDADEEAEPFLVAVQKSYCQAIVFARTELGLEVGKAADLESELVVNYRRNRDLKRQNLLDWESALKDQLKRFEIDRERHQKAVQSGN